MSQDLRSILNTHKVATLRKEIRRVMKGVKQATEQEVKLYFAGINKMTKPMLIEFMMREPAFYSHMTPRKVVRARRKTTAPRQPRQPRARQPRQPTRMIPSFMGMGLSGGSRNARNSRNLGTAFRQSLLEQVAH